MIYIETVRKFQLITCRKQVRKSTKSSVVQEKAFKAAER